MREIKGSLREQALNPTSATRRRLAPGSSDPAASSTPALGGSALHVVDEVGLGALVVAGRKKS